MAKKVNFLVVPDWRQEKYMFFLYFASPDWVRGEYTEELQIEVHREYLMWTAISMVGSIGGQLGLWVGFSFAGFLSGFMSKLTTVWHTLSKTTNKG